MRSETIRSALDIIERLEFKAYRSFKYGVSSKKMSAAQKKFYYDLFLGYANMRLRIYALKLSDAEITNFFSEISGSELVELYSNFENSAFKKS